MSFSAHPGFTKFRETFYTNAYSLDWNKSPKLLEGPAWVQQRYCSSEPRRSNSSGRTLFTDWVPQSPHREPTIPALRLAWRLLTVCRPRNNGRSPLISFAYPWGGSKTNNNKNGVYINKWKRPPNMKLEPAHTGRAGWLLGLFFFFKIWLEQRRWRRMRRRRVSMCCICTATPAAILDTRGGAYQLFFGQTADFIHQNQFEIIVFSACN